MHNSSCSPPCHLVRKESIFRAAIWAIYWRWKSHTIQRASIPESLLGGETFRRVTWLRTTGLDYYVSKIRICTMLSHWDLRIYLLNQSANKNCEQSYHAVVIKIHKPWLTQVDSGKGTKHAIWEMELILRNKITQHLSQLLIRGFS